MPVTATRRLLPRKKKQDESNGDDSSNARDSDDEDVDALGDEKITKLTRNGE